MISVLALALVGAGTLGQIPGEPKPDLRPLSEKIGFKPTGKNGYEEYVAAAEIVESARFRAHYAFLGWVDRRGRETPSKDGSVEPAPEPPLGLSRDSTILEARRSLSSEFSLIVDLIRAGNRKKVADPRAKVDFATSVPELAGFKAIARFVDVFAYARFADGNSASAVDALIECLRFSQHIRQSTVIHGLVGNACQSIALASIDRHMAQLSARDAQRLAGAAREALAMPDPYARIFASEHQLTRSETIAAFERPEKFAEAFISGEAEVAKARKILDSLTAEGRSTLRDGVLAQLAERYGEIERRFGLPEAEWLLGLQLERPPDAPEPEEMVDEEVEVSVSRPLETPGDLAALVLETYEPMIELMIVAVAKSRTQLRLLRLHGLVLGYKWANGSLPAKLTDAARRQEIVDPFTSSGFQYEQSGPNTYRLFSVGFGETGPIELRYRRPVEPAGNVRKPRDPPEAAREPRPVSPS